MTLALTVALAAILVVRHESEARAGTTTSRFVAVGPSRVADTRTTPCGCDRIDGATVRVSIAGRAGVPDDAVAVALTVTATRTLADGFVTVHPAGTAVPVASTLNVRAGADVANAAIVPLGDAGAIDVWTSAPMDLVVDVTGAFVPAASATSGRFVAMVPERIADTRAGGPPPAPGQVLAVALPSAVPADALALAVNLTSVDAPVPGFVTAVPAGGAATTSVLNVDGSGAARAASAIVPVTAAGFEVASSAGGHLIVDVVGWFTGASAPAATDGLFVPQAPHRVLDTRVDGERIWRGGTRELPAPAPGVAAVVTNVTMDRTDDAGFVTATPAGAAPASPTSSLNASRRGDTVANLAITPVSTRGTAYTSHRGTDLIVDVAGWFTGTPLPAIHPPAPNVRPPRVLLVGDSTMSVIRYVPASQVALDGIDAVVDGEPCRRLVFPSCRSNTTYRIPNTAYEAITATPGSLDAVVIMTGYNDWFDDFGAAFDTIVGAARAKGARHVLWLTYVEGGSSPTALRAYQQNNRDLRAVAPRAPDVTVADWNAYSRRGPWMAPDGIHLTPLGAYALADYIARFVAHVEGRPCDGSGAAACPDPDTSPTPDLRARYGV